MTSSFTLTMCSFKTIPDVKKGSDVFLPLKECLFPISVRAASHPVQQSLFWDGHQRLLACVGTKREQSLHANKCDNSVVCCCNVSVCLHVRETVNSGPSKLMKQMVNPEQAGRQG